MNTQYRRLTAALPAAVLCVTTTLALWPTLTPVFGSDHSSEPAAENAPEAAPAKAQAVTWTDGKPQAKPEVIIKSLGKSDPKAEPKADIKADAKPLLASAPKGIEIKSVDAEKKPHSGTAASGASSGGASGGADAHAKPAPVIDPLTKLVEGNKRFVSMSLSHPGQSTTQRLRLATGQKPFAIVLGCSDSRVPPEVVFDQGLGDLFVIRVAGNVVDPVILASIEYAAGHLNSPLIVVLGHERCGAVHATAVGDEPHGHLSSLVELLQPAVTEAKSLTGDVVENAVRLNVKRMVTTLRTSKPVLADLVEAGKLKIVGARYDLDTGEVEFMP